MKHASFAFLLLALGTLPCIGNSQPIELHNNFEQFIEERLLLHTDRQLYITGETIWFKIYAFSAQQSKLSDFSKVANLELISHEGNAISRVKVELEKGIGEGAIELPDALRSGRYILRAYTQAMRNNGSASFCKQSLIILNPEQPLARAASNEAEVYKRFEPGYPSMDVRSENYLNIAIQASSETYSQRGVAILEISTADANDQPVPAHLSLSVSLRSSGSAHNTGLFQKVNETNLSDLPKTSPTITFRAENLGMHLEGKAINRRTQTGEGNIKIYLAFPGKTALVYSTESDETGQFSFLLPKLYGLRQMIIQAGPEEEVPITIELTNEFHKIESVNPDLFVLPPHWLPLANAALVNAQVRQAYQAFEQQPVYTTNNQFVGVPFFGQPDVQYHLNDYTRFPLPEFFYEVVPEVRVRGKFGEERLRVLNDWERQHRSPDPLLLVDGVPVFDQKTFLKINNKLIASTEVVMDPFWLNPDVFDGIIQISSFEGDARSFPLPESALRRSYLTLLPERQFVTPDHNDNTNSHMPDFRNTLYWNPSIRTDASGKATVIFSTSDAIGEYEIRVEGVSDTGLLGTGKSSMRVAKNVN